MSFSGLSVRTAAVAAVACLSLAALLGGCGSGTDTSASGGTTSSGGAGGTTSTGGTGGITGGTGGITGGTGGATGGMGGALSGCVPPLEEVTPSGTDDIMYGDIPLSVCFAGPCMCGAKARTFVNHILACDAVGGGFFTPQGETYVRVVGRAAGACLVDITDEVEGGVELWHCELPLPMKPWVGIATQGDSAVDGDTFLAGIADACVLAGQCCDLPGCPDPCSASPLNPSLCLTDKPAHACE